MLPSSFSSLLVLGLLLAAAAAVPQAHAVSVRRTTAQRSAGTTARIARGARSPHRTEARRARDNINRSARARAHSHGLLCVPMPGCSSDHVTTSLCLLAVL